MKSPTWMSETEPDPVPINVAGWLRVIWRGILMGGYTFGGFVAGAFGGKAGLRHGPALDPEDHAIGLSLCISGAGHAPRGDWHTDAGQRGCGGQSHKLAGYFCAECL